MYFPLYIAKRYLISKSSQNAVNIINGITFLVVVIGAASLFIVLSGFAGLKTFSLSFTNSFDPDMKVIPATGKFFVVDDGQEEKLKNIPGIVAYSKELEERVFLSYKQKNHVAYVKGVDTKYRAITQMDSLLFFGNWFNQSDEVVVGLGVSNLLGIGVNDYLNPLSIIVPKPGKGSFNTQTRPYNQLLVNAVGVYSLNEDVDKKYVFAPLSTVQELLRKETEEVTAINLKLKPDIDEATIRAVIENAIGTPVIIKNRIQLNDALYKMLNTENLAIYLIFTLVLIIALFNVAGAIIMMILDKKENLKTLYSMGASVVKLKRVFFIQGMLLVMVGGFVGVFIGIVIAWAQIVFEFVKITPSLAYPMEIQLRNILLVLGTIILLGFIASKISSGRISKKLIT
ncbi:ABC transporter permease [Leptobacterium sp. I13]|uniref:ABC transporter permease n=1 Tax=Leptobacterium meishanense TaxID=3128904 RepID=UPI0030EB6DFE